MENSTVVDVACIGKRISLLVEGKEAARAYLYILTNDLHQEPFGLLEDVYVDDDMRGQGLGTKIVQMVISTAREAGCYKLIATSRTSRAKVHDLYRRIGFVEYGKEFRMNL